MEHASESSETRSLLEQVRGGDDEAFNRLFARHRPFLRRTVELRMDPQLRQRVDPSDLVQEAHLEAARRLPAFLARPGMPFKLWLRQIVYDRLIMTYRRHVQAGKRAIGREMPLPDQTSLQLARRLMASGPTPSQVLMRGELAARVQQALARMSAGDREVLIMRNLEGLSNREIAEALHLEPSAVSKRYGRALLRLRGILNQPDEVDQA